jgi:ribonuclease HI
VVCRSPEGVSTEHSAYVGWGTNQIAELTGALEGLRLTPGGAKVLLVSDSQYVLKGLSEWREGWERRGWRNAKGDPVANAELWRELFKLADARDVEVQWVKGHSGHPENERCDALVGLALSSR